MKDKKDQHVLKDQMYVGQLLPVGGIKHPWPLVFVPGGGQTGTVSYFFFFILGKFPRAIAKLMMRSWVGIGKLGKANMECLGLSGWFQLNKLITQVHRTYSIRPMAARAGHPGF